MIIVHLEMLVFELIYRHKRPKLDKEVKGDREQVEVISAVVRTGKGSPWWHSIS